MSAVLELCDLLRAVGDRCETLGLTERATTLRSKVVTDYPDETRRQLVELTRSTRDLRAAAAKANDAAPGMLVVDSVLGRLGSDATVLESDANSAIALCDRVIEERFAARQVAKASPPILSKRRMNLHRSHDR